MAKRKLTVKAGVLKRRCEGAADVMVDVFKTLEGYPYLKAATIKEHVYRDLVDFGRIMYQQGEYDAVERKYGKAKR